MEEGEGGGGGGGVIVERIKRGSKEKQSSEETITVRCGNCFRGLRKWLSRRAGGKAIRNGIRRIRSWVRRCDRRVSCEEENNEQPKTEHVTLDRYKFSYQLGKGAFGKVMLAKDMVTGEQVALKQINKSNIIKHSDYVMIERRVLELTSGCPFLSHAYAAFQTEKHLYFVLEYASGGTLLEFLKKNRRLDIHTIRFLAAELICGIQFLHSKGIVHRDLKPSNILMSSTGHVTIADFGLALENMFDGQERDDSYGGTHGFMAPEIINKESYSQSIDWWSFGVMLYMMATGKPPFTRKQGPKAELTHEPKYPLWLDTALIDLIQKLLCKSGPRRLEMARSIRQHDFFWTIDWEKLQARELEPPFTMPSVKESPHDQIEEEAKSSALIQYPFNVMIKELFKDFSFVGDDYKNKHQVSGNEDEGPSAGQQESSSTTGTSVNEDKGPSADQKESSSRTETSVNEDKGPSADQKETSPRPGSDKVNEHEGKQVPSKAPQVRHHSLLIYKSTSQARRKAPSTV